MRGFVAATGFISAMDFISAMGFISFMAASGSFGLQQDPQRLFDQLFDDSLTVLAKGLGYPVGYDRVQTDTGMSQELPQPIDSRRFHLKVGDPVGPKLECPQPVDELRVGQAQAQDSSLGPIKAGAGNRDPAVEAIGKQLQEGTPRPAYVGVGDPPVHLRMGDKSVLYLLVLFVFIQPVKIKQVI